MFDAKSRCSSAFDESRTWGLKVGAARTLPSKLFSMP